VCNAGKCETPTDPCKGISFEGCCDGKLLQYCEDSQLKQQQCQQSCGWDKTNGFYDCGFTGADPSGQFPIACAGCTKDCTGKACGDDGCGGSCGTCPAGKSCQAGACVSCTPNCTGKQCGDDGCGGSCGTCPASQVCNAGKCETQADPCKGISYEGCCDGTTLNYCDSGKLETIDCGQNEPPNNTCGWNADAQANFYDCGQTGADPSGKFPLDCGGICQPNCTGKQCGDNGCGGACGTCDAGCTCSNGKCMGCGGDCTGKECGPDGQGGSCGTCQTGFQCSAAGKCEPVSGCGSVTAKGACDGTKLSICVADKVVTTDCAVQTGFICGYSADQGKYQCMDKATCKPDCTGRTCGSDDCGGSCGTCKADEVCQVNTCVPVGTEPVPDAIEHPDVPPYEIPVQTDSTGPDGPCVPDCNGRACGSNGCGGTCGTCKAGFGCSTEGLCVGLPKTDSGAKEDVSSADVPGPSTDTSGKSGGGGCSAGGGTAPFGLGLVAVALGLLVVRRRREG
jgi:MYXO-CTERM domain-containing protein